MIVQCASCQARFKIADEKVTERGVKVRCSKCSTTFVVRKEAYGEPPEAAATPAARTSSGEVDLLGLGSLLPQPPSAPPIAPSPPSEPPRPSASTKTARHGAPARTGPEADADPFAGMGVDLFGADGADPFADERSAGGANAVVQANDPFAALGNAVAPRPATPAPDPFEGIQLGTPGPAPAARSLAPVGGRSPGVVAPVADPLAGLKLDLDSPAPRPAAAADPLAGLKIDLNTPAPKPVSASDPFAGLKIDSHAQAQPASASKSGAPISLDALPMSLDLGPSAPESAVATAPAGGLSLDLPPPSPSAPSPGLFADLPPAPEPAATFGPAGPGLGQDSSALAVGLGLDKPPEPEPEPDLISLLRSATTMARPTAPPTREPRTSPKAPAPASSVRRRTSTAASLLSALMIAALGLVILAAVVARKGGGLSLRDLAPGRLAALVRGDRGPLVAVDVTNGLYETQSGRSVFVVRGAVQNRSSSERGAVRVAVALLRGGEVVGRAEAYAGGLPTPEEVWSLSSAKGPAALESKLAAEAALLEPGGSATFAVLFSVVPEDLPELQLKVTAELAPRPPKPLPAAPPPPADAPSGVVAPTEDSFAPKVGESPPAAAKGFPTEPPPRELRVISGSPAPAPADGEGR